MTGKGAGDTRALAELRDRIDAIDAQMHSLLVERGTIIDSLIRTKRTDKSGAAFRPGREADMMRRLVQRHEGRLPLTSVEHIWREIITTFTRMQAPFNVAIDASTEPERMRDLARFYFGFSVELIDKPGAADVVAHVAGSGDLGIVPWQKQPAAGAWWRALARPSAPRIMAVLPYIAVPGRPADLPAFVISPPLADPVAPDIRIFAVSAAGDLKPPEAGSILAQAGDEVLLALPAALDADSIVAEAGGRIDSASEIGGVARGITVDGPGSVLYQEAGTERTIA